MNNQQGVDYTVFIPSFRGDPNFVGCLLQKGDSNFGHYTCLHHDIESGNLYYMDSCTGSILVKSEKQLRDILCDKKVWGIFTKKHLNYEHGWVDTWCRYVRENKNDDIYIKHLIQYYFVENKEILTIQTEQDKYNLMQFRKQSLCDRMKELYGFNSVYIEGILHESNLIQRKENVNLSNIDNTLIKRLVRSPSKRNIVGK
eukprot:UN28139